MQRETLATESEASEKGHFYGGKFHDWNSSFLPFGRALKLGESFFTTMKWRDGRIHASELHCERLKRSFDYFNLGDPGFEEIVSLVEGLGKRDLVVRVTCLLEKGKGVEKIISWSPPPEKNDNPVRLIVSSNPRRENFAPAFIKFSNYFQDFLELESFKGFDDVCWLDRSGCLTESSTSNLVFVEGGRIFSPIPRSTVLEGVSVKLFEREADNFEWKDYSLEMIGGVDEIYLVNGVRGVRPVSILVANEKTLYEAKGFPSLKKLQALWEKGFQ